ncbi:MAG: FmdB family zinc ribbon protein [Candidatus Omnitrophota bacterium]|nr:FmdB family zinc ribbon protein [Candidatus Omnitrophota bacterium]
MPTYEYECEDCDHRFEKFQSMSAERIKQCPECKGRVKRLIGKGAGIIFKGSGFYATDYRKASPKDSSDKTCCGRTEPCKKPPCSDGGQKN